MAGRGPEPKDPSIRARRNKDTASGWTVATITPAEQPSLDEAIGPVNPATGEPWQLGTIALWRSLKSFPTTASLLEAQWLLLARAMILDDAVLAGGVKASSEARLQLQKFGIAPDDVARLRYSFALADEAEARGESRRSAKRRDDGGPDPRLKLVE